jgi:hypothetical protein
MNQHQIVAIGDLHLQSMHPRNAARLAALDQIVGEGLALLNLAAWVMLGDLFHGRSTTDDRNQLSARLQKMADVAPVVIVVGNHEQPGDLDIFAELKARWPIRVCDRPNSFRVQGATGIVLTVAALPYPHKANLIAGGLTADQTLQAGGRALEDIVRGLCQIGAADYPLFLAHVNIGGSICSNGQPNIGRELEMAAQLLDLFGPRTPKLLGHIHKPQSIGGGHYVGSVCRLDWNEIEAKRYGVLEYHTDPHTLRQLPLITWKPIDVAPMYHVEGQLTRDGFQVDAGDYPETWSGAEIRVRYRYAASERNVLDHALVRVPFEGALRLEVEPVAVPDRALRAPEVAAARTLPAKIQAWANLSGASVTDGVLAKLALLEHGDPTSTLSAVANRVAAIEAAERAERVA